MSSPIYILATLTPKPGKADRVIELLQSMSKFVNKNEPGTLKYEINVETKPSGAQEVVMVEIYKDKAAVGAHMSSKEMKTFQKVLKDEDLSGGSMQLKNLKTVGGFSSRL